MPTSEMKTLVLAGGFGTRLRPLSCSRPKMLFPIANKPLIDYNLEALSNDGVETVILAVYYMAESLVRYLGPTKYDLGIMYSREQRPLGTGGPIKKAKDMLNGGRFMVMNGDILKRRKRGPIAQFQQLVFFLFRQQLNILQKSTGVRHHFVQHPFEIKNKIKRRFRFEQTGAVFQFEQ